MSDDELREIRRQAEKLNEMLAKKSGEQKAMSFGEFAVSYMAEKLASQSLRENTKRSFQHQTAEHLIPAFGKMDLAALTNKHWMHWVSEMQTAAAFADESGERVMRRFFNPRKYLCEIMNAAKEAGHIERVPKFENPDAPKTVGRVLEDREVIALIWRARRPFRFIFYTFWKMGCRPREILSWEWTMIRPVEGGAFHIDIPARISKTDRSRTIPIDQDVTAVLKRMTPVSRFVFPHPKNHNKPRASYHAAWATACRRANVLNAMPYDNRRTFITKRAIEGKSMLTVAKFLDTSIKMIESVYAKIDARAMEGIL